jgi:dTDP-4-dehydrorhamnose reductase
MIHIVGSTGFIGKRLIEAFKSKGLLDFIAYSRYDKIGFTKLDLLRIDDKIFDSINKRDVVVFLAAISSPDFCEENYEVARKLNVTNTEYFIKKCLNNETNVIFISSDLVYGNNFGINDEFTLPSPIGRYAEMKLEIEKKFGDNEKFKILRLSYVLSDNDKFFNYLNYCYENNLVAEIFDGIYRNVVLIEDVLESIINLTIRFNEIQTRIINVCGDSCLSRVHLAKYFINNYKIVKYKIIEVPSNILKSRPNKIEVKSLYLEKLLKRKVKQIII